MYNQAPPMPPQGGEDPAAALQGMVAQYAQAPSPELAMQIADALVGMSGGQPAEAPPGPPMGQYGMSIPSYKQGGKMKKKLSATDKLKLARGGKVGGGSCPEGYTDDGNGNCYKMTQDGQSREFLKKTKDPVPGGEKREYQPGYAFTQDKRYGNTGNTRQADQQRIANQSPAGQESDFQRALMQAQNNQQETFTYGKDALSYYAGQYVTTPVDPQKAEYERHMQTLTHGPQRGATKLSAYEQQQMAAGNMPKPAGGKTLGYNVLYPEQPANWVDTDNLGSELDKGRNAANQDQQRNAKAKKRASLRAGN